MKKREKTEFGYKFTEEEEADFRIIIKGIRDKLLADGFNFIEEIYPNGYFFDGDHKMWHFEVKECPDWLFGVWIDNKDDFSDDDDAKDWYLVRAFAQHKNYIDKFKPTASSLLVETEVYIPELSDGQLDEYEAKRLTDIMRFVREQPYLAWYRDVHMTDFNLEYISPEKAKKDFEESEKERIEVEKAQAELDAEEVAWMKNYFDKLGVDYHITTEENCVPRHTVIVHDKNQEAGWWDVISEKDWMEFNGIYEKYKERGFWLWQTFNRGVLVKNV